MVYFYSSISVCNSVDQASSATILANSVNSHDIVRPPNHRRLHRGTIFARNTSCLDFAFMYTRKCRNPNCKGLRKAAKFDIQLETEECVKNSSTLVKDGVKRGLSNWPGTIIRNWKPN
ncbi:Detected protein of confused Function [Hibiscus syriacus]|uniref:Detected protein of confused Function n=1 Tax=Hibiscus syriacus TaxID=106335 RepID=A0A6A3CYU5_HIBSY|nr:Detected protein of confused Function [Hibiscus syriacus]